MMVNFVVFAFWIMTAPSGVGGALYCINSPGAEMAFCDLDDDGVISSFDILALLNLPATQSVMFRQIDIGMFPGCFPMGPGETHQIELEFQTTLGAEPLAPGVQARAFEHPDCSGRVSDWSDPLWLRIKGLGDPDP